MKHQTPIDKLSALANRGLTALRTFIRESGRAGRPDPAIHGNYHEQFKACELRIRLKVRNDRKKVLHVIADFGMNGSSRVVASLFERLGHIYEQEVMTCRRPEPAAFSGLPVHVLSPDTDLREVIEAVQRFNPDGLHLHYPGRCGEQQGRQDKEWYAAFLRAAETLRIPVMENIDTAAPPLLSASVEKYVSGSQYIQKSYGLDYLPQCVIYPGCDPEHFLRRIDSIVPDDCIGTICRLERDTFPEEAMEVFIEVVKRQPSTRVLIVGGGSLLEIFRRKVEKAGLGGSFTFTGYVAYEALPGYYEKMSVFVAPMYRAGFSQAVAGAMHMGLPVAGFRSGSMQEIIAVNSLLAAEGKTQELVHIVLSLLQDRERRLQTGAYNRLRAQQRFHLDAMIQRYAELYGDVFTCERTNNTYPSLSYEPDRHT